MTNRHKWNREGVKQLTEGRRGKAWLTFVEETADGLDCGLQAPALKFNKAPKGVTVRSP